MEPNKFIDPELTLPDTFVLKNLLKDIDAQVQAKNKDISPSRDSGYESQGSSSSDDHTIVQRKNAQKGSSSGTTLGLFADPTFFTKQVSLQIKFTTQQPSLTSYLR